MTSSHTTYTVHDLRTSMYTNDGRSRQRPATHASVDGGQTPMCGQLEPKSLYAYMNVPAIYELTCGKCRQIVVARGLVRTSGRKERT